MNRTYLKFVDKNDKAWIYKVTDEGFYLVNKKSNNNTIYPLSWLAFIEFVTGPERALFGPYIDIITYKEAFVEIL